PAPQEVDAAPVVEARRDPLPHPAAQKRISWFVLLAAVLTFIPLAPLTQFETFGAELASGNRALAAIASVVIGLALLVVVHGLFRRKRRGWELAMILLPVAAVLVFLRHPDVLLPVICLAAMALLWSYRSAWTAPADPRTSSTLVRFIPAYLLLVGAYGGAVLVLDHENVSPDLSLGGVLETVYGGLLGFSGPYTYETRFLDEFFEPSLLVLGIVGLAVVLYLALRPSSATDEVPQEERDRARELVRRYGSDTLAYFALRPDKRYFFGSDGEAMIAYAYVSGHALAAGDPIGAPQSVDRCLAEFMDFCHARAWRVAFLAIRDDALPKYRALGLRGIYLGDEAIIPCQEFTLKGAAMKSVRGAVGHVRRDHRFELIRASEATPALVQRLNEISEHWRGENAERGFTMALAQDVEGVEPDFLLALCRDRDDRVVAFLRLVPAYGDDPGYSLDLMRREPDAVNGATEFLIAMTALRLGELGFARLSMNFAPWARLFNDDAELGPFDRVQKAFAKALNPFFQISSLRTFNAKFAPRWLGRAIAVEDTGDLAKVGVLYAAAEGFLDVPVIGPLLTPKPA
ncbi:MAG: bifunctional lysylphosphatidylglycerol flippase/synthetase MprF, partial [Solirubrobacteraceae bacterium]